MHVLADYEQPEPDASTMLVKWGYHSNSILFEFEQHLNTLEKSNSIYNQADAIYKMLEVAILEVRAEVKRELQVFTGQQPLKVRSVRQLSTLNCLLEIEAT